MRKGRRRILITAGPTQEPFDPVRFMSNASSGAMGIALAEAVRRRGGRPFLICGPTPLFIPRAIPVLRVRTAREMARAVREKLPSSDAFVATAAVCDWRFKKIHRRKKKKGAARSLTVMLVKNPDILADAGRWRASARGRGRGRRPFLLVGFALETNDVEAHAAKKLAEKNLDLIVGNSPESFSSPFIRPVLIERGATGARRWPRMTKSRLSSKIAAWLDEKFEKIETP